MQVTPLSPRSAARIFVAYSHKDVQIRDELEVHLAMLKRNGLIEIWHDRLIVPGTDWNNEIHDQLEAAEVFVLLVSPDFLNSDYCVGVEMKRALERHQDGTARVIPVIVRPCSWADSPLAKIEALPKDAQPVTRWTDRDEALLDVATGIKTALELRRPRPSVSGAELYSPSGLVALRFNQLAYGTGPVYSGGLPPRAHVLIAPDAAHINEGVVIAGFVANEHGEPETGAEVILTIEGGEFAALEPRQGPSGEWLAPSWKGVTAVKAGPCPFGNYVAKVYLSAPIVTVRARCAGHKDRVATIYATPRAPTNAP
jgi:hypothetical protein